MSEIDTVSLRLPDYGREITNWSMYRFNQQFLTPTSAWSFSISDEDTELTNDLLVEGALVQLVINDNIQATGYVERRTIQSGSRGTTVTVQGRDILGPVVDATIDPDFHLASGMSIPQFVLAVLAPYGITKIYNSDAANINIVTGLQAGKGGAGGTTTVQVPQQQSTVNPDGTITLTNTYVSASVTQVSGSRPDLKTITLQQLKPHSGEGVYAFIDRVLRRLGFTMWAMADGSGVVIDKADFTTAPSQKIVHSRTNSANNNVIDGTLRRDIASQPSAIFVTGKGGGQTTAKAALRVLMINELVGLTSDGQALPNLQNLAGKFKVKPLAIRKELPPFKRPKGDRKIAKLFFLKDDESKTQAQLEAFVRREMANRQMKALQLDYQLLGHTSDGTHPWGVNTNVAVEDEVLGVKQTMWVVEKEFTKSNSGGTMTSLKLILPYTLQIAV